MNPTVTDGESPLESPLGIGGQGFGDTACAHARGTSLPPVTERVGIALVGAGRSLAGWLASAPPPASLAEVWRYATQGQAVPDQAHRFRRLARAWGRGAVVWCGACYALAAVVQVPLRAERVPAWWRAYRSAEGLGVWSAQPVPLGELYRYATGPVYRRPAVALVLVISAACYLAAWCGARPLRTAGTGLWVAVLTAAVRSI
jgi:hypothetical protein